LPMMFHTDRTGGKKGATDDPQRDAKGMEGTAGYGEGRRCSEVSRTFIVLKTSNLSSGSESATAETANYAQPFSFVFCAVGGNRQHSAMRLMAGTK
jgi:hypothetical protein